MSDKKSFKFNSSDALTQYFSEVGNVVMLSAKEERRLIQIYKDTDDAFAKCDAKDRIVKGALKFVIREARRQPRSFKSREALEDLIAAGNIGLVRALDKFDLAQGTRFLTYAGWWVRHEMREENKHLNICHVPTHAMSKGVKVPIPVELNESTLKVDTQIKDTVLEIHNKQSIEKLLTNTALSIRESFIIKTCFGIDTRPKTLRQVGKLLVITGERVRQLREGALTKMRVTATSHL